MQLINHEQIEHFMLELVDHVNASSAVNNYFYLKWESEVLTVNDIEIVLANYFARTINTVLRVADVVQKLINPLKMIKDENYRNTVIENMHNLQDELGTRNPSQMHVLLLTNWINNFLNKLGSKITPIEDNFEKFLTEETKEFIVEQKNLYRDDSIYTVIGASFAQEIIADCMMSKLKNGYINNYQDLYNTPGEFYQTTNYFATHVFGTEENHAKLALKIIISVSKTQDDLDKIQASAYRFVEITSKFWQGILNKLSFA